MKWGLNACETKWRAVRGNGLFKVPGLQVAADGGCEKDLMHRMNERY